MIKNRTFLLHILCITSFLSCRVDPHRVHEKQSTPTDIRVSSLDFDKKQIELRFEYRTYVKKTLDLITCQLSLNQSNTITLKQENTIDLDSFSTEILTFNNLNLPPLSQKQSINYSIDCEANYSKGKEYISKQSVLHLVPTSQNKYR